MTVYTIIPATSTKSFGCYLINHPFSHFFFIITGIQLQQIWNNIQDSYTREVNRKKTAKSGSAASGNKQYIFFSQLNSLQQLQQTRRPVIIFRVQRVVKRCLPQIQLRHINTWLM